MNRDLTEAIRSAMQVEKNAMDYYLACAGYAKNEKTKKLFDLLAREEKEHAHSFYEAYPGDDIRDFESFVTGPPAATGWLADLGKNLAEINERKAMLHALDKEKALAENLRAVAQTIHDPAIKAVYEENARSTECHFAMIEEEYARLMAMVHPTDMDIYVRE